MNTKVVTAGGVDVAVARAEAATLADEQSALDFMMTVRYETGCARIALNKEAIDEAFFDLRTGLAGGILQKFVNYQMKFAIVGDFSSYTSKALRDFIYECNNGRHVFFATTEEEAVERLSAAL